MNGAECHWDNTPPNRRIEKKAAQKISILVEDWKYKEELPVSKGLGEPLRDTHGEFWTTKKIRRMGNTKDVLMDHHNHDQIAAPKTDQEYQVGRWK